MSIARAARGIAFGGLLTGGPLLVFHIVDGAGKWWVMAAWDAICAATLLATFVAARRRRGSAS